MEFTVFTSAGGFREFPGQSTYRIGAENGVLYVTDGTSGQVLAYGPSAWASVQEWQREGVVVPPAAEQRLPPPEPDPLPAVEVVAQAMPPLADEGTGDPPGVPVPRRFDPLTDPLDSFAD